MLRFFAAVVVVVLASITPQYVNAEPYTFHKSTTRGGAVYYTFTGQDKPRLEGRTGTTCDALSVNKALNVLDLPSVSKDGRVGSLLTSGRSHLKKYIWDDLSSGALTIVSTQCQDQGEPYECLWQVRI